MSERPGILWFVLDESSRIKLGQAVPARYKHLYYHHVTLLYGVERETVETMIGQSRTITTYAEAYNKQIQAVRVDAGDLPDTYGVPHITLSTIDGVKPFASVAMLQGDHVEERLAEPITLDGTLEFIYIDQVRE